MVPLGQRVLRANGVYVHPATTGTEVRLVVGHRPPLLAVAAVLALALGALLRRSAAAVTAAIVLIVLPYLLAMTVLPPDAGASGCCGSPRPPRSPCSRAPPQYPQVDNLYTPANGYFPLPPWAGLAVLAGWAALGPGAGRGAAAPEGRMRHALHAEWTKLRTSPGTVWLLLAVVAATVGRERGRGGQLACPAGRAAACDPTRISLTGVQLGQAVVAVLAVLADRRASTAPA